MKKMKVKKVTLDVVKPVELKTTLLLEALKATSVKRIEITSYELERNTEYLKLVVEGDDLETEEILTMIKKYGAAIQNMDALVAEKEP